MPTILKRIDFEPIDLTRIDEKIRKLQMLRELASDPELRPLLRDIVTGDGTTSEFVPVAAQVPIKPKVSPASLKGVRREVFKYVPEVGAVGITNPTAREIMDQMKHAGYKFRSKDHL